MKASERLENTIIQLEKVKKMQNETENQLLEYYFDGYNRALKLSIDLIKMDIEIIKLYENENI